MTAPRDPGRVRSGGPASARRAAALAADTAGPGAGPRGSRPQLTAGSPAAAGGAGTVAVSAAGSTGSTPHAPSRWPGWRRCTSCPCSTAAGAETAAGAIAGRPRVRAVRGAGRGRRRAGAPAARRPAAAAARALRRPRPALVVRGVLVAIVGFALVELTPPVAVILAYYGLLFVLATPLLRLRAPVLAAAAAVWCVAGPALSHVLRAGRRAWPGDQPGFEALGRARRRCCASSR